MAEPVDVCAWLHGLGLERYEDAFRANEIDWEVLPELNEGDLEKLGVPLGPRKKLLRAIATLQKTPTAASPLFSYGSDFRAAAAERITEGAERAAVVS